MPPQGLPEHEGGSSAHASLPPHTYDSWSPAPSWNHHTMILCRCTSSASLCLTTHLTILLRRVVQIRCHHQGTYKRSGHASACRYTLISHLQKSLSCGMSSTMLPDMTCVLVIAQDRFKVTYRSWRYEECQPEKCPGGYPLGQGSNSSIVDEACSA